MHRQMVTSLKKEIYFGSDPTLILFLLFLYVGLTTLFYSTFESFPPVAAILIPHQARLRRVPVKDKSIRLFSNSNYLLPQYFKTLWEPFRMTIHQDN